MEYTKGPWVQESKRKRRHYYEHGEKIIIIGCNTSYFRIANVEGPSNFDKQTEMRGNARLIAASPELYEALKEITPLLEEFVDGKRKYLLQSIKKAKAALEVVEGRE